MKTVQLKDVDGKVIKTLKIRGIKHDPERAILLEHFKIYPSLYCIETNVRRYTASDIYAGRSGQMI